MRYLDGLAVDELRSQTDSSGNIAWYVTDNLGSVTDVVNTSGTDLDHIVYDPYGNIVTQTNATNAVRFGFTGMEFDSTTGLYYDHARYYDPVTGRFMSQDPIGFASGDTNPYRYVGNEPTSSTDPTGEFSTQVVTVDNPNGGYTVTVTYKPRWATETGFSEPVPTHISIRRVSDPPPPGLERPPNPLIRAPLTMYRIYGGGVRYQFVITRPGPTDYLITPFIEPPPQPGQGAPPFPGPAGPAYRLHISGA